VRRYKAGQRSKEARGRLTRLQRMERLERPQQAHTISLRLESDLRSGELVVVTRDLCVGYDHPLLTVPDMEFYRLQRAALIGANGTGKTTLIRTLLGQIPPLSGEARLGASLRTGYLAQTREDLDPTHRVVDAVSQAKELPLAQMRHFLARYLFTGDDVFKRVGDLSGGEQCRVALAKLTLLEPNFLVLDEPTNQLDIASQETMEQVLQDFVGTILFVSHDRYLIDALATQVWLVEEGALRVYKGDYQEYLVQRQREAAARRAEADKAKPASPPPRPRSTAAPRREIHEVEQDIAAREDRLQELAGILAQAGAEGDLDTSRDLGVEYTRVQAEIDQLMVEWVALGEANE